MSDGRLTTDGTEDTERKGLGHRSTPMDEDGKEWCC